MSQVEPLLVHGVPAHTQGGTPLPLPAEQTADALETIEFGAVLERVAGARRRTARGRAGAALAGPPTTSTGSGRSWRGVGEVAGLFRRGDALLAEPIPDVTRAVARLRIEGQRARRRGARRLAAGPRRGAVWSTPISSRVAELAPLAPRCSPVRCRTRRSSAGWSSRSIRTATCWTPPVRSLRRPGARCRPRGSASFAGSTRCFARWTRAPPHRTPRSPCAAAAT